MQTALLFTPAQINLIVIIAVVIAVLFAANAVILTLLYYKRKKSKLCTEELQQRREQLLEELAQLRYFTPEEAGDEEAEGIEEIDDIEEESDDEEIADDEIAGDGEAGEVDGENYGEILAVRDMPPLMRGRFGFTGAEFERKRYYVRYVYSFEAKLRTAKDEVKEYYRQIMDEAGLYGGIKSRRSFRHERIFVGKKTIAMFIFRGKTLCVALALNPADYADTKYRGKDVANVKRFSATPMLIRITSARKAKYARHLVSQLAALEGFTPEAHEYSGRYFLEEKSMKELYVADLLKVIILGEAPDIEGGDLDGDFDELAASGNGKFRLQILAVRDMSPYMRRQLGFVGKEPDNKRYYVRYSYGFEAKLRSSDGEVKQRYVQFVEELGLYKKLLIARGFRQQRLYFGRKTVGLLLFKGKTLCVAFALNPQKYETTKYRGIDVSGIKRFEKTPMLVKITSARRLAYAKYLLNRLAEEHLIAMNPDPVKPDCRVEELTRDEYFEQGMLKITVIGEVPDGIAEEK